MPEEFSWQTLAHELGHTFGMGHDFRDDTYIMSFGRSERRFLSACSAGFLAVHPYFNPDVGVEWAEAPAIELLSAPGYPEGSENVSIRLRLSDAHGLHLVRLRVPTRETHNPAYDRGGWELKLCRGMMGEEEAEIEIEYDGVVPSGSDWGFTDLSDPKVHPISLIAVDRDGNRAGIRFHLWEVSRQHLATFELAEKVHALAFAPGGTTLASGSGEGTELWDLETRNRCHDLRARRGPKAPRPANSPCSGRHPENGPPQPLGRGSWITAKPQESHPWKPPSNSPCSGRQETQL